MNIAIFSIFATQCVFALLGAYFGSSWLTENLDLCYMAFEPGDKWSNNPWLLMLQITGTWILIFT